MPRSASDAVSLALQHVRQQLWPFRWREWWRIALLGLGAGELSGGGCGTSYPGPGQASSSTGDLSSFSWLDASWLHQHAMLVVSLAAGMFLVFCVAGVLWAYVTSVCRIALIEAILRRDAGSLRAGWRAARVAGRQFFVWQLGLQVAGLAIIAVVVGVPVGVAAAAGWFTDADAHAASVIVTILATVGVLVVSGALWLTVYVLSKDFLAPMLAVAPTGLRPALRRWLAMLAADKWSVALYVVLKVLLSIPAIMIAVALLLIVLVPFFIAAFVAGLLWVAVAGATWNATAMVAAAVAVLVFMAVLMAAVACINVPFVVFFPAYGLYFLAPRYAPLAARLEPEAGRSSVAEEEP